MNLAELVGFPRLDPPWGATDLTQQNAVAAADLTVNEHYLPDLEATERSRDNHLLYGHCLHYQIRPEKMRRMKINDLRYLASHSGVVAVYDRNGKPMLVESEKLRANADRAKLELDRRHRWAVGI